MQLPARWIRGVVAVLLLAELCCLVPWPWSVEPYTPPERPSWNGTHGETHYYSTQLLNLSHQLMKYNKSSHQYEAPPLAFYESVDELFRSQPVAAVAAWWDLLMTARRPWATYWLYLVLPQSWRLTPLQTQHHLELLLGGKPVLTPLSSASISLAGPGQRLLGWLGWSADSFRPHQYALCTSAVNATTLQPAGSVTCTLHDDEQDQLIPGSWRRFTVLPESTHQGTPDTAEAAGGSTCVEEALEGSRADSTGAYPVCLGPGLIFGPLGLWFAQAAARWRPAAPLLRALTRAWQSLLPTAGMTQPLCPLLSHIHLFSHFYPTTAFVLPIPVLVVIARNWLFLITVAYKISRRLALLAPAPLPARLPGILLTFVGMFLGLWQSQVYAMLDVALRTIVGRCIYLVLSQSSLLGILAADLLSKCAVVYCLACLSWEAGRQTLRDARMFVMAPQAFLVNNNMLATKLPRRQVATLGTWPTPLTIPEEVDELPVSDVPRGFICPITQAIMRQPALLLHDRTIAPSTYDKEAISQWLAEHSSDPKNPGVQLCMKSVKLVYNGDLGRSIEDWVATQQQQQRQQQQQTQGHSGLAAWRRAISGQIEGAAVEGAAAAAGVLLHMRGNMCPGTLTAAGGDPGFGPAAAAAVGPSAAAAAGRAAVSGSILSGAGALARSSSAALAHVASLDLPAAAVAGLQHLAGTTRRMTTRSVARHQHRQQQQQQEQPSGMQQGSPARRPSPQQQQQQRRRRRQQQHADEVSPANAGNGSSDGEGGSSGSSSEVNSRRQLGGRVGDGSRAPRRRSRGRQ